MSDLKDDEKVLRGNHFNPRINIGIDFGTDGTAIGYSFPKGNDTFIYGKWNVFTKNKGTIKTDKTRTAILLDKNGEFEAFGIDAIMGYDVSFTCFVIVLIRY